MSAEQREGPGFDPMIGAWRETAADLERQWNEFLTSVMATDEFARLMAKSVDGYLNLHTLWAKGLARFAASAAGGDGTDEAVEDRIARLERQVADLTSRLAETGRTPD